MSLFHVVDDAQVILRSKGVYRQAKIYRRERELFAAYGSGFIKLLGNGGTSIPNMSWLHIDGLQPVRGPLSQPLIGAEILRIEAA